MVKSKSGPKVNEIDCKKIQKYTWMCINPYESGLNCKFKD